MQHNSVSKIPLQSRSNENYRLEVLSINERKCADENIITAPKTVFIATSNIVYLSVGVGTSTARYLRTYHHANSSRTIIMFIISVQLRTFQWDDNAFRHNFTVSETTREE